MQCFFLSHWIFKINLLQNGSTKDPVSCIIFAQKGKANHNFVMNDEGCAMMLCIVPGFRWRGCLQVIIPVAMYVHSAGKHSQKVLFPSPLEQTEQMLCFSTIEKLVLIIFRCRLKACLCGSWWNDGYMGIVMMDISLWVSNRGENIVKLLCEILNYLMNAHPIGIFAKS